MTTRVDASSGRSRIFRAGQAHRGLCRRARCAGAARHQDSPHLRVACIDHFTASGCSAIAGALVIAWEDVDWVAVYSAHLRIAPLAHAIATSSDMP